MPTRTLNLKQFFTPVRKRFILIGVIVLVTAGLIYYQAQRIQREPENLWGNHTIQADCGVVLTGAPGRLREGFELLAQKRIKKLIVSGVYRDSRMAEIFPYAPYYPEVDLETIFLDKRSETTFGNARHSLSMTESLRCRDIVLITSQVHMHRAYSVFKMIYPETFPIKKLSLPNSKGEAGTYGLGVEVIKSLFYYILSLADDLSL